MQITRTVELTSQRILILSTDAVVIGCYGCNRFAQAIPMSATEFPGDTCGDKLAFDSILDTTEERGPGYCTSTTHGPVNG